MQWQLVQERGPACKRELVYQSPRKRQPQSRKRSLCGRMKSTSNVGRRTETMWTIGCKLSTNSRHKCPTTSCVPDQNSVVQLEDRERSNSRVVPCQGCPVWPGQEYDPE